MRIVYKVTMVAVLCAALQTMSAVAQDQPKFASDEYLLIGDTNRGAGEPEVAVNPKDPNNIVVVGMSILNSINGHVPSADDKRGSDRMIGLSTPNGTIMRIAVTHDGGVTWDHQEDTIRHGAHTRCSDPTAAAGPDGVLYVGCINRIPAGAESKGKLNPSGNITHAEDAISVSIDKGVHWSGPINLIGNEAPYREYAPGVNTIHDDAVSSPFDRPWVLVDQASNTLYMFVAHTETGAPPRRQSLVIASPDNGSSWGLIHSIDSSQYPQSGGSDASAARGVFAVAFVASKSPGGGACPCVVFGASKDQGKSFAYYSVPLISSGRGVAGLKIAADPSRSGHFALMTQNKEATQLLVTETEDGGKSWTSPVVAGEVPGSTVAKAWLNFSPKGDLATVWRGIHADKSYDMYSTLSRDGGKSFSQVLRVSHATSPPPILSRANFTMGDDTSSVVLNDNNVYMAWGDYRAGFQGTWYGRVPISAYQPAQ